MFTAHKTGSALLTARVGPVPLVTVTSDTRDGQAACRCYILIRNLVRAVQLVVHSTRAKRLTQKIFGLITKKKESISLIKRQSTVRKNRLCATATDSEIAAIAKDWFRFACDRDGGRKRRQEQKRAQQAATATINAVLSDNSEQD
ncbi:uncharacterized protein LOC117340180 [Pecten maximus]|uniref:uncharacterized protein LOC117319952 n=1 Tax=Pecten maximus TaxID=6579 RepID=UPI0014586783|nr:uncharacterized protein LOC117319952 [Pecten maximus]XP_033757834.1 uncharacterized protein LOC117340180 [Pecten maximus]